MLIWEIRLLLCIRFSNASQNSNNRKYAPSNIDIWIWVSFNSNSWWLWETSMEHEPLWTDLCLCTHSICLENNTRKFLFVAILIIISLSILPCSSISVQSPSGFKTFSHSASHHAWAIGFQALKVSTLTLVIESYLILLY